MTRDRSWNRIADRSWNAIADRGWNRIRARPKGRGWNEEASCC